MGPTVTFAAQVSGSALPAMGLSYSSAPGRWVLAASVLGSGIATLDATVVGIALPSIGRDFHVGVGALQWVVTGYTLTLAAFLLLGGSLGDRYGRRRVFAVGVASFALASAACGLAPDAAALIAARLVQGVGGALLTPASLAMLEASFAPADRSRAIGAWSGLGGLATATGPLVGGYLISALSWRAVFFINLPLSAVVLAVTARHVPESRDPAAAGRIDVPGAVLATVLLSGLTFALIEGPSSGWTSPLVLAGIIAAPAAGAALIAVDRRKANPMLPVGLFAVRQFSAANAVTFFVYGALGGALFLLPVELQVVKRYSALASGVALLPVTAIMLAFSARSGRLAARLGPRAQMSIGPVVAGVGLALLARATHPGSYAAVVLPAIACFGAGLAITVAPLTTTAMEAAPPERAGAASAVNNVVARAAGLLAVAVLPVAIGLTGDEALRAATLAPAFQAAVLGSGAMCALGGLLAAITITNPMRPPDVARSAGRWHCALAAPPARGPA